MGRDSFYRFWQLRGRRVLGLKRPSSRGGAEAEDPVGREPWTGPAVAMGTAGRRRRAEAGCPAGQFRGAPANDREWPPAGHLGPRCPGRRSALILLAGPADAGPLQPAEPPPT